MALTAKQQLFIVEYTKDQIGAHAAIRAGYSAKGAAKAAFELLRKPEIQAAIAAALEGRMKRVKVDSDWVLRSAQQVFERCMQVEAVFDRGGNRVLVSTPDGDLVPAFTFDSTGANRSLEIIGKHVDVQAFRVQVGLSNPKGGPVQVEAVADLTDEQLAAELAKYGIEPPTT